MEKKKLYKSINNKKLAGVCGGVAKYLGMDATLVRILWFVITWFYGFGLILYIAMALILSDGPEEIAVRNVHANMDMNADMTANENVQSQKEPEPVVDVNPQDIEVVKENDIPAYEPLSEEKEL